MSSSALPSPPFLPIPGMSNFRDIGLTPVSSPPDSHIKPGVLFRSGYPSNIDPSGLQQLQELGITHVYDLRSTIEVQRDGQNGRDGSKAMEKYGMKRYWTPVFKDEDYSPEMMLIRFKDYAREGTEGFTTAYHSILLSGAASFTALFLHLAYTPTACLIHCTAGKDRTGVFVALVLGLCGCSDDAIAAEYALTELGFAERKAETMEMLLKLDGLSGDRSGVERMVSARKENMLATLEMIRREFGGVEEYVRRNCGLKDRDVETIRERLVVSD
ncbi:MAG: hypothetical protein M1820_008646 [Bogoriella megaspora]|nr:MAG: hypothetical protein M1820_008646 [Bogoriella megaspora]